MLYTTVYIFIVYFKFIYNWFFFGFFNSFIFFFISISSTQIMFYQTLFVEFYISLTNPVYNTTFIFILFIFLICYFFYIHYYFKHIFICFYTFLYWFCFPSITYDMSIFFTPPIAKNVQLQNGLLYIHPLSTLFFYSFGFFLSVIFYYLLFHLKHYHIFLSNKYFRNQYYYLVFNLSSLFFISICLGSYWSFQELTWNGWWDWDIIEIFSIYTLIYLGFLIHKSNLYFIFFTSRFLTVWVSFSIIVHFGFYKSIHNFIKFNLSGQYKYYYFFFIFTFYFFWFYPNFNNIYMPVSFHQFSKKKLFYSVYTSFFIFLVFFLFYIAFYVSIPTLLNNLFYIVCYVLLVMLKIKSLLGIPRSHMCVLLFFFILFNVSESFYILLYNFETLLDDEDFYFYWVYWADFLGDSTLRWFKINQFYWKFFYIYVNYVFDTGIFIFVQIWAFLYLALLYLISYSFYFVLSTVFYKKLVY